MGMTDPHDPDEEPPFDPYYDTAPAPTDNVRHLRPNTPRNDPTGRYDNAAEQAVIGAILGDPTGRALQEAATVVAPTDFWVPQHEQLYNAAARLHARGEPIDPILVLRDAHARSEANGINVSDLLRLVHDSPALPGSIPHYAAPIRADARLRAVGRLAHQLHKIADEGTPDGLDGALALALQALTETVEDVHGGDHATDARLIPGGTFLLDGSNQPEAIWGQGDDVLWARGETCLIAGGMGTGKTTLAQQAVLARIGVRTPHLLGYPLTPASRVLYLAMDRPQQARRSLRRMCHDTDRDLLDQHLVVWKGPPPGQIVKDTRILLELAQRAGADTVVVDSVKDVAVGIASDEVGAAVNTALQELLAADIDVLALHHVRKQSSERAGKEPDSIDEIYGSTWITAGAGSVISLHGQPGDPVISFKHLKQPAEPVGPYELMHDHQAGITTVSHGVDILDIVKDSGMHGVTAIAVAVSMFPNSMGDPSKAEVAKAGRKLDALVRAGQLVRKDGAKGTGNATRWFLAAFGSSAQEAP